MAACVERRAACGASYNACASGATPCKFETRQPARPAGKARADRQFQRRVRPHASRCTKRLFNCGEICHFASRQVSLAKDEIDFSTSQIKHATGCCAPAELDEVFQRLR